MKKTFPFFHSACGGKESSGFALGIEMKNPCLADRICNEKPRL